MDVPDITATQCPYCGATSPTRYIWREIQLHSVNPMQTPILGVEVYCQQCHRTISVTPVQK